jgi:hypothetical protein
MGKTKQIARQKNAKEPRPAPSPPPPQGELDAALAYADGLMKGETKVGNPFAADLVDQLRTANDEMRQLAPRLAQLRQAFEQGAARRTALEAIGQQLAMTLYKWKDKPETKEGT